MSLAVSLVRRPARLRRSPGRRRAASREGGVPRLSKTPLRWRCRNPRPGRDSRRQPRPGPALRSRSRQDLDSTLERSLGSLPPTVTHSRHPHGAATTAGAAGTAFGTGWIETYRPSQTIAFGAYFHGVKKRLQLGRRQLRVRCHVVAVLALEPVQRPDDPDARDPERRSSRPGRRSPVNPVRIQPWFAVRHGQRDRQAGQAQPLDRRSQTPYRRSGSTRAGSGRRRNDEGPRPSRPGPRPSDSGEVVAVRRSASS